MAGMLLMWAPVVLGCAWWQKLLRSTEIDQPIVDPVQHLESGVEPALLKAVPPQTVEQRFDGIGCPVSEIVAGIPCCSTVYLLKLLGVFLLVGVPGCPGIILQC